MLRLDIPTIRQMIKEKFRTQSAFAEHLGWAQPRLSRVMNGSWENTRISTLGDLCIGLDVTPNDILLEDGEPAYKEMGPEEEEDGVAQGDATAGGG